MRPIPLYKAVWLFLLFSLFSCRPGAPGNDLSDSVPDSNDSAAGVTTVYFVRHAEKDTSDARNEDPDLTTAGNERAVAFRDLFEGQTIDALYATKYKRTQNTLKPLSEERQLLIREYDSKDFEGLRQRIMQEHLGKTVVVAGHSNTLLPLLEAFGAERPIPAISESEYFYLFKVIVGPNQKATVEMSRFGNQTP